jgi:hypothetical protein
MPPSTHVKLPVTVCPSQCVRVSGLVPHVPDHSRPPNGIAAGPPRGHCTSTARGCKREKKAGAAEEKRLPAGPAPACFQGLPHKPDPRGDAGRACARRSATSLSRGKSRSGSLSSRHGCHAFRGHETAERAGPSQRRTGSATLGRIPSHGRGPKHPLPSRIVQTWPFPCQPPISSARTQRAAGKAAGCVLGCYYWPTVTAVHKFPGDKTKIRSGPSLLGETTEAVQWDCCWMAGTRSL